MIRLCAEVAKGAGAGAPRLLIGRLPSLAELAEFLAPYARCVAFTKPNEDHHIPIRDSDRSESPRASAWIRPILPTRSKQR